MGRNTMQIKRRIDQHRDEIVNLYEQGLKILEIAARFSVSNTPIRRILHEENVKLRKGYEVLAAKGGPPKGPRSKKWKGGRWVNKNGYVMIYVPTHPSCHGQRLYVLEHRLVMEKHIGRYLEQNEHVHHIDGNRANNVIENLKLVSNVEHATIHNPKGLKETRLCENCGKPVTRSPSQFLDHVFCSQPCRYAVLAPLISKKRWASKGHGKQTIYCDHCGISMERWSSQIHEHNFCSNACRAAASRGAPRGTFNR